MNSKLIHHADKQKLEGLIELHIIIQEETNSLIESILIETKRLRLIPMTYDFVVKIMENDSSAYSLIGAVKTETWPEAADIKDILHIIRDSLSHKSKPDGFDSWVFINKEDNRIVGDGGFKGSPDENGIIDMGYAIVETERRKGLALEAASALLKWGLS